MNFEPLPPMNGKRSTEQADHLPACSNAISGAFTGGPPASISGGCDRDDQQGGAAAVSAGETQSDKIRRLDASEFMQERVAAAAAAFDEYREQLGGEPVDLIVDLLHYLRVRTDLNPVDVWHSAYYTHYRAEIMVDDITEDVLRMEAA